MKSSRKKLHRFMGMLCLAVLVGSTAIGCKRDLRVYEAVTGDDGSQWEQVSKPGFGNKNNGSIGSMAEFQDSLYAVTRNDVSGFELWRTRFGRWDKVRIPGFTDSVFHDLMINVWSDLIVFQDKLYVAVSSGYQGSKLYKSLGFEIWRFDGRRWEAVVSHTLGPQMTGRISSIASCEAGDGSSTAEFTDSDASWNADQFKDGILWITSGEGKGRAFDITGNTADTLTVQQNEAAGTAEDTVCDSQTFIADPPFPPYSVGAIAERDTYKIIKGVTANGFGELWNKSIVDLETYNNELYASVGFNYEKGARVWKSADGLSWEPSSDYSMGSYHGYDPEGNPSGVCLIPGLESRNGQPVSSSLPRFGKFTVGGEEIMVIGGTGTGGCNGRGVRIFRLYDEGWKAIVDYFVDANDNGTNENGIGDDGSSGDGFTWSNFQAWSWAVYDSNLFTGMGRPVGGRILYTPNADPADGNWQYAVGGDSDEPEGLGYNPNIVFNIFALNSTTLIAGTIEDESFTRADVIPAQRGADIWWATGATDNLTWTPVTRDAFGDATIVQFESPRKFGEHFYIAASSFGPSTPLPTTPIYGAREGYTGAKVYRLASELK